jgi:hypothetical protein
MSSSTIPGSNWTEAYLGGTPEAEVAIVRRLASRIQEVQAWIKTSKHAPIIARGFHAKMHVGLTNATFHVSPDLPPTLRVGFLQPGAAYPCTLRLSNAAGSVQPDSAHDLRGAALRVRVSASEVHDLLMTNGPVSHARNPQQFIAFARAMAGSRLVLPFRLLFGIGPFETIRIFKTIRASAFRVVTSLANERYWSRAPMKCGPVALKYQLDPAPDSAPGPAPDTWDPNYLRREFVTRLAQAPVEFDFKVQLFIDERQTPIEDGAVEWREQISPLLTIGRVIIPRQDLDSGEAQAVADAVDKLEFNPWHTTADFRPLGSLNRARQMVYTASADHRFGYRFHRPYYWFNAISGAIARRFFLTCNRFVPWHKLPQPVASLNLIALRQVLRQHNLFDSEDYPDLPMPQPVPRPLPGALENHASPRPAALGPGPYLPAPPISPGTEIATPGPDVLAARTPDVAFNDLADPAMGGAETRFGRLIPLDQAMPNPKTWLDPSPREVSRVLLTRDYFKPVKTLNVLAAAWIQFMVHGWFNHRLHRPGDQDLRVPLNPGDPWPAQPMTINASVQTSPGHPSPPRRPPTFVNTETSWWDASQLYGSRLSITNTLRSWRDGKLNIGADGYLPLDPELSGIDLTGFNNNWWLGLGLLHTLFVKEHNAICDALKREYPLLSDDELFVKARLINAALIGKIHTIEWTPGILANPVLQKSMDVVWSGAPKDWLTRLGLWFLEKDAMSGVPGSLPVHHAARYTNTEEFVAVYKMHPLMPDDFAFHSREDDRQLGSHTLTEVQGKFTRAALTEFSMADQLYSFGVAKPGAITLHNFPRHLQNFTKRDQGVEITLDLATVDILRERERGVPRYNDFRELFHMPRIKSWKKLTANPRWAAELEQVYGHIDKVDTMVGMFAETPPKGFGFSDTTFRVFVLTATRRIQSDRFFTVDFTPEVYTPLGMQWVKSNGMKTVLLRHHPDLLPHVQRIPNVFGPWNRAATVGAHGRPTAR